MTALYDMLPWNRNLLLDLQYNEGVGVVMTGDYAGQHHIMTQHGTPTWTQLANGLSYLDFEQSVPDWLDCPDTGSLDLDFTSGDFTLATWLNLESAGLRYLMSRGLVDVDGWEWYIDADSQLTFGTHQAAAHQYTIGGVVPTATWLFAALVRDGAGAVHYVNSIPSIGTAGVHVNPLTSARELHVGSDDTEAVGFDGGLWRTRIWNRALSAADVKQIFNVERGLFGI